MEERCRIFIKLHAIFTLNFGLATAWRKATTRDEWRLLWTQQCSSGVRSERRRRRNI